MEERLLLLLEELGILLRVLLILVLILMILLLRIIYSPAEVVTKNLDTSSPSTKGITKKLDGDDGKTKGWTLIKNANAWEGVRGSGKWYEELCPVAYPPSLAPARKKEIIEKENLFGYSECLNRPRLWWPRTMAKNQDDILNNIIIRDRAQTYVKPGATIALLKEKEKLGFEIIYDKLDS